MEVIHFATTNGAERIIFNDDCRDYSREWRSVELMKSWQGKIRVLRRMDDTLDLSLDLEQTDTDVCEKKNNKTD